MTAIVDLAPSRPGERRAEDDRAWREQFRALVLEVDRRVVALDIRCWPRTVPGGSLSVIDHLQHVHARCRAVPRLAPIMLVPEVAAREWHPDPMARAVRPATLLHTWRREAR